MPLTEGQRVVLEKLARPHAARHRDVQRARALLLAANGVANTRIGADLGVSATTVSNWRKRLVSDGLKGIGIVRPGRGLKPSISSQKVAAIVARADPIPFAVRSVELICLCTVAGLTPWALAIDNDGTHHARASSRPASTARHRANSSASLRSVLTRSLFPLGVNPGAITCIPTPAAIAAR